jgi:hypothetical protein
MQDLVPKFGVVSNTKIGAGHLDDKPKQRDVCLLQNHPRKRKK